MPEPSRRFQGAMDAAEFVLRALEEELMHVWCGLNEPRPEEAETVNAIRDWVREALFAIPEEGQVKR